MINIPLFLLNNTIHRNRISALANQNRINTINSNRLSSLANQVNDNKDINYHSEFAKNFSDLEKSEIFNI